MFQPQLKYPVPVAVTDAAKGVLILLVIFGHAGNFYAAEPFLIVAIKFFHVPCFLLMPFVHDLKAPNRDFMASRITRYYVPFALFAVLYGILNLIAFRGIGDVTGWLGDMSQALILANGPQLDRATQFTALWFLPAYMSVVIILACGFRLRWEAALHITAGLVAAPYKFWFPMGLVIAAYILFLGLVLRLFLQACDRSRLNQLQGVFWAVFGLCLMAAFYQHSVVWFPVILLPSLADPLGLVIHGTLILSAFLILISGEFFTRSRFLRWCGQNSLQLYLLHLPIFALASKFLHQVLKNPGEAAQGLAVLAVFGVALGGVILAVQMIDRIDFLKRLFFPKAPQDWPPLAGLYDSKR